jgi:hypothetical protein
MASTPDQAARIRPHTGERAAVLSGPWLCVIYALALALLAWPIVRVGNPMLTDYPNHLARLYVTEALGDSAILARFWFHQPGLYPYLPFDLLVQLLSHAIGLEPAGRMFIVLALVMPGVGTIAVAKALHGRIGLFPLASALFAYNLLLSWGLVTFLFSLGLALLVFAAWIATDRWAWPWRLALFATLSSLMFCAHPFAFAALGLLIGTWELGKIRRMEWEAVKAIGARLFLIGLQFIPAIILAALTPRTDVGSDFTQFGSFSDRMSALLSPVLFLVEGGEVLLALALVLLFALALHRGVLAFDRRMLVPTAAIGFASLLMPAFLSGIYLVHIRLPLLAVLLVIASCRLRALPRGLAAFALALAAAVLWLRVSDISSRLTQADREIVELRAASSVVDEGARVLPAVVDDRGGTLPARSYWHAAAYLTIDRSAFFPLLFSFFNIGVTPEYTGSAAPATSPVRLDELDPPPGGLQHRRVIRDIFWQNWRRDFDYVLLFDFGDASVRIPEGLTLVRRGTVFAIYKIDR